MADVKLGRIQLRIMQALWDRGRASARELTDALAGRRPLAHSTVQTLLRQLEAKRAIGHDIEDRTFIYRPLIDRGRFTRTTTRDLIERVFAGSASGLVAHLLKDGRLSPAELATLRALIQNSGNQDPEKERS